MNMPNMQNNGSKPNLIYARVRNKIAREIAHLANHAVIKAKAEEEILDQMKPYIFFMNGDCYVKRIKIDFPDKKARYYLLLQALVENTQVDGSCSYEAIINHWKKHGVEVSADLGLQVKSIHNAIVQLYVEREDQKVAFPPTTPNGEVIIEKKKNRIMFNNPIMNE